MKKLTIFASAVLLALAPNISSAQQTTTVDVSVVATQSAAATQVLNNVKAASAADRNRIVREAIQANPDIAGDLTALLIAEYPTQAADYTSVVVQAVIALDVATVPVAQKATILNDIASKAVPAALLIDPARITQGIVETVNDVKAAIDTVVAGSGNSDLVAAVSAYVAPLAEGEVIILSDTDQNTQEEVVVSGDTLFTT